MRYPKLPDGLEATRVLSHNDNRLVVLARDINSGEGTVVKCLLPPFSDEEAEGIRNEFLHLDALDHPNWVRPRSFGEMEGEVLYFTSELVHGQPLDAFPVRGWQPGVLEVSRCILSALHSLHLIGVAQLDLKPDQVLVSFDDDVEGDWGKRAAELGIEVVLLDLGLASPFGAAIPPVGTPGYMAPELLRGEENWDARADLYAFGAILFELVTGYRAFEGDDPVAILRAQSIGLSEESAGLLGGLPAGLRILLRSLLEPDPLHRPGSALQTWMTLRELVPAALPYSTPVALNPSRAFPFLGRELETSQFIDWSESVTASFNRCLILGRPGVGSSRLKHRCAAIALSRGWTFVSPRGDDIRVVRRGIVISIDTNQVLSEFDEESTDQSARRLQLQSLDSELLTDLVRSRGIESSEMSERLVVLCLGVPELLDGVVELVRTGIERSRILSEDAEFDAYIRGEPPGVWVEYAKEFLVPLSTSAQQFVLLAAWLRGSVPLPDAEAILDLEMSSCRSELAGLEQSGLLAVGRDVSLLSPIWGDAILEASGDKARIVVELIASKPIATIVEGVSRRGAVAAACALCGNQASVEKIVVESIGSHRWEEGLLVFAEALAATTRIAGYPKSPIVSDDVLLTLFCLILSIDNEFRLRVPEDFGTDGPPCRDASLRDLFRAWYHFSFGNTKEFTSIFGSIDRPTDPRLASIWSLLKVDSLIKTEGLKVGGEAFEEFVGSHVFTEPILAENTKLSEIKLAGVSGDVNAEQRLLDELRPRVEELLPPNRAKFWISEGANQFASGSLATASISFLKAIEICEGFGLTSQRLSARQTLVAVTYLHGDLQSAYDDLQKLVRESVRRGIMPELFVYNCTLVATQMGLLGTSLAAVADLQRMGRSGLLSEPITSGRILEAMARGRAGDGERALELLDRNDADPNFRLHSFNEAVRGEVLLTMGKLEEGRAGLDGAVTQYIADGSNDDAAETLSHWLRLEIDLESESDAIEVYGRYAQLATSATGLAIEQTRVLEAEMASRGWLDFSSTSLAPLEMLVAASDRAIERGLLYVAWRPLWRAGQLAAAEGPCELSNAFLERAKTLVLKLTDDLADDRLVECFLSVRPVSRFLDDLQGINGPD